MKKNVKNLLKNMLKKIFSKIYLEPSDIFIITVPSNKLAKTRFKAVTVCNISYWKVNKKK